MSAFHGYGAQRRVKCAGFARLAAEKSGSRASLKTCLGLWGHHCRVPD